MDKAMHEEWTDKLSEYVDGELPPDERYAVESHLSGCAHCAAVLEDLQRVIARAQSLSSRPPQADLWGGVSARIDPNGRTAPAMTPTPLTSWTSLTSLPGGAPRRISITLPQALAASIVIALISGALTVRVLAPAPLPPPSLGPFVAAPPPPAAPQTAAPATQPDDIQVATVSFADAQYDAAVADLENAVKKGRGRLDTNTIAIVEHNLQIIDQAIDQARQALAADPANAYLSSHLFEARRRKLDLLRRAAALSESD
jgi:Putative zinc-finger